MGRDKLGPVKVLAPVPIVAGAIHGREWAEAEGGGADGVARTALLDWAGNGELGAKKEASFRAVTWCKVFYQMCCVYQRL